MLIIGDLFDSIKKNSTHLIPHAPPGCMDVEYKSDEEMHVSSITVLEGFRKRHQYSGRQYRVAIDIAC